MERITLALRSGEIDLAALTEAARHLNEIDERHPYRIETAVQVAAQMG